MAYPCGSTKGHICLGARTNPSGASWCLNAEKIGLAENAVHMPRRRSGFHPADGKFYSYVGLVPKDDPNGAIAYKNLELGLVDDELKIDRFKRLKVRPDDPSLANFPEGTDVETKATRRLEYGQWRTCVLFDWGYASALTGGSLLLHACHLVDRYLLTDAERMDRSMGILLESCYNDAMYKRYIWFEDDGTLVMRKGLETALDLTGVRTGKLTRVTEQMVPHIRRHRELCLKAR